MTRFEKSCLTHTTIKLYLEISIVSEETDTCIQFTTILWVYLAMDQLLNGWLVELPTIKGVANTISAST